MLSLLKIMKLNLNPKKILLVILLLTTFFMNLNLCLAKIQIQFVQLILKALKTREGDRVEEKYNFVGTVHHSH